MSSRRARHDGEQEAADSSRVEVRSVSEEFQDRVTEDGAAGFLHYYGRTQSRLETAELVRRLSSVLEHHGVEPGSRVAVCLQNTPTMVATVLAAWNAGATVVPVNPMLRERELGYILEDSAAVMLISHAETAELLGGELPGCLRHVLVSHPWDLAGGMDAAWSTDKPASPSELLRLASAVEPAGWRSPGFDDVALLTYTSGTTGPSKGAMNTHANVSYVVEASREWFDLLPSDGILSMAPLFHITGAVEHLALAAATGSQLTLTYRFEPERVSALVESYRPSFTVGAITAFVSLLNQPSGMGPRLESLTKVFSGGAPVPSATVGRYAEEYGAYIHNIYGLTETTSACIAVPRGKAAPVDPDSGALSIGVPLPGTEVRIVADDGTEVPPGEIGEITISGPGVVPGYWNRAEETASALRDGWLATGDVGRRDEDGWIYVVDRKKDIIIASGYKVWPRDVEDVLYEHPAVAEAAAIGVPDAYRGETVHAYVSLRDGTAASEEELIDHCRASLAAYKAPRRVHFLAELPKTATGKIRRRDLREA